MMFDDIIQLVTWLIYTLQAKNQFSMTSARLKNGFANQLYMLRGLTVQSIKLKDPLNLANRAISHVQKRNMLMSLYAKLVKPNFCTG